MSRGRIDPWSRFESHELERVGGGGPHQPTPTFIRAQLSTVTFSFRFAPTWSWSRTSTRRREASGPAWSPLSSLDKEVLSCIWSPNSYKSFVFCPLSLVPFLTVRNPHQGNICRKFVTCNEGTFSLTICFPVGLRHPQFLEIGACGFARYLNKFES